MQYCFGVAMRLIDVTKVFQLSAKISVVVDLTVVSDMKSLVFIGHRLMTGLYIDNAQPPVAQPDSTVNEDAFVIRTAISDHIAHAFEDCDVNHPPRSTRKSNAVYATHRIWLTAHRRLKIGN
jgi:hypothetical protein